MPLNRLHSTHVHPIPLLRPNLALRLARPKHLAKVVPLDPVLQTLIFTSLRNERGVLESLDTVDEEVERG